MTIAHKHFSTMVCSTNHPAGRMHSMQSVSKIKLEHIKKCYDSFFAPDKSIVVIAGGFDTNAMRKLIAKSVETWTCKRQGITVIGQPLTPFVKTAIKLVDKKDLTQTSLIIGHPMPGELHPHRNELALANYVLGGGNFSSRLMAYIRSKKGKTYGISSQISCNREFGVLTMSTSTQNDQVADMLESIHTVYREFADKSVTAEELEKAKQFAIGNMAFQLEGIVNISDKFLWLKQFDRDVSFVEQFESTISAISLDAVSTAIKTSFTGKFAIVAVGKKDLIYDKLTPYGEVSVVDFRSNPA
jgi:predicted Zn-dependent peptidase